MWNFGRTICKVTRIGSNFLNEINPFIPTFTSHPYLKVLFTLTWVRFRPLSRFMHLLLNQHLKGLSH